jgi:hypothetical protein
MPPLLSAQNVMTHLILHSNLPKPLTNQADRATLHKLLDKSTQNREDYQTNIQKMESMLDSGSQREGDQGARGEREAEHASEGEAEGCGEGYEGVWGDGCRGGEKGEIGR